MAQSTKELPERNEIPDERKWKLEDIFATDEEWEKERDALQRDMPSIEKYKGIIADSSENLYNVLHLQDQLAERLGKFFAYAHMRSDEDTTNATYQAMEAKAENVLTMASSSMSFIVPEILAMDEATLKQFLEENDDLKFYEHVLHDINRQRPHILSEKEEALLAEASEPMSAASNTFSMLNDADLKFPTIQDEDGNDVDLTQGRFIGFMQSNDREVRKAAFKAMYQTYDKFINTFASTLSGMVKANNFNAKVRHYDSARQAALDSDNIPEQVYDNLIEAVNERLPALHRYMRLRKQILGLDELHMYDIYTPLVKDVDMSFSYEEAQKYVLEGLKPLGDEYVNIVKHGFNSRWIDVEENKGKRSGAYSSGAYGTHPYILLNWQNQLDDVFTLAHELGHSLHTYYTTNNQPFRYGDYSIFVAEVASTTNEALMNDYLLNQVNNEKERLYLLNHYLEGFRGTVFRQTMFAEFEHEIHKHAQKGEALTADNLTSIYHDLNKKYYGEDMISDEEIGKEWARIPHFYMNYYVYQYATGYSAATALADKILNGEEGAVDRYLDYLKAGSSDYPIEVLKKAGVDMTSKEPILSALDVFEEKLDEMEKLLLNK